MKRKWLPIFLLVAMAPASASEKVPVLRGYWAHPPSACASLSLDPKLTDPRLRISDKSRQIAEKKGYRFEFLDETMEYLADTECEINEIKREGSIFLAKRRCGEDGESSEDFYKIEVKGTNRVLVTDPDDDEAMEFGFCTGP